MSAPIDRPRFKEAAATFDAAMQDAYGKGYDDGREQGRSEGYQECLRDAARALTLLTAPSSSPVTVPPLPPTTEAENLVVISEYHHHARSKKPRARRGTVDVPVRLLIQENNRGIPTSNIIHIMKQRHPEIIEASIRNAIRRM